MPDAAVDGVELAFLGAGGTTFTVVVVVVVVVTVEPGAAAPAVLAPASLDDCTAMRCSSSWQLSTRR